MAETPVGPASAESRAGSSTQVLDYDSSTYQTFHRMTLEWPCLSFDIVRDGLGEQRDRFPLTMYAVAGTQADTTQPGVQNSLLVLKMSQLNRTQHDSDDEADSVSDEDEGDAVLEHKAVQHNGAVNRVKCQTQCPNIVATWAETGSVHVFDVAKQLALLDGPLPAGEHPPSSSAPPLQTFDGTYFIVHSTIIVPRDPNVRSDVGVES